MTRPAQLDFLAELTRAVAKEVTREVVVSDRAGRWDYDFSELDPRSVPRAGAMVPPELRIEGFDP